MRDAVPLELGQRVELVRRIGQLAALDHPVNSGEGGNILGGIAMQTVVLVVLDVFGLGKASSLTYKAASLVLVIEATMVLAVLTLVVIGNQFGSSFIFFHSSPVDVLIFVTWITGLFLILSLIHI